MMTIDPKRLLHGGIFIISLPRAQERRVTMAAQMNALGLPYTFVDGVDGQALDLPNHPAYARAKRLLLCGTELTPGELGCLLSHRTVYERIGELGLPAAVVLEDDAILDALFPTVVQALCQSTVPWDMVRFLARDKTARQSRQIVPLCGPYTLNRPYGTPGGAYGYVLTAAAAARLVPFLQRNWLPVDLVQGQVWQNGLDVLSVVPSPVRYDRDVPSCIGKARLEEKCRVTGWRRVLHLFARAAWKTQMAFCKNYVWLRTWPADMADRRRQAAGARKSPCASFL